MASKRDDFKQAGERKRFTKNHKSGINIIRLTLDSVFSKYERRERETHIAKRIVAAFNLLARLLRHGVEHLVILISIHELDGFV